MPAADDYERTRKERDRICEALESAGYQVHSTFHNSDGAAVAAHSLTRLAKKFAIEWDIDSDLYRVQLHCPDLKSVEDTRRKAVEFARDCHQEELWSRLTQLKPLKRQQSIVEPAGCEGVAS
jgi:hypothetical protein